MLNDTKPKSKPKVRSSWSTYLYLDHPHLRGKFIHDFRQFLKQKLPKRIDVGGCEKFECPYDHDPRNPDWKPFRHFEQFCLEQGLDDLATREYLEQMWGRTIICECEFLVDSVEERKEALRRQFGVDFDSGGVGLVD
jgi:hypothetical protein